MPELYITYDAGAGKQTEVIAYDVSSVEPLELGYEYLATAPKDQNLLEFS